MSRLLLVPHGGSKNDTLVTVEIKLQALLLKEPAHDPQRL